MAKKYVGANTLLTLMTLIKAEFKSKMDSKTYDSDGDGKVDSALNADSATNATTADKAKDSDKLGGVDASKFIQKTEDGKLDPSLLPSYVDDVLDGYYHEGYFYKSDHTLEEDWPEDDRMVGETGKIYVDVLTSTSYRYSGSTFVQIVSSDMIEITSDEVNQMWTTELSA